MYLNVVCVCVCVWFYGCSYTHVLSFYFLSFLSELRTSMILYTGKIINK